MSMCISIHTQHKYHKYSMYVNMCMCAYICVHAYTINLNKSNNSSNLL